MSASGRVFRRDFLRLTAGAALLTLQSKTTQGSPPPEKPAEALKIVVFSKHLQWLDGESLAQTAAEMGFDGVDLTVRTGGHVLPERVEQDLPKLTAILRKAGLALPMVTTGIVDVRTPYAENVLRALKDVGIPRYRWGGFQYIEGQPIPERLTELKQEAARLAALNQKYDVCAMYHTHSGSDVGASIWDLWVILKDLDTSRVSVNLDIAHATIEGGLGAWITNTRLILPMTRGIAIKDFKWVQNRNGEWRPQWCPLGEGMVNFKRFFAMLKQAQFSGPIQLHFEYSLGGAENGARTLSIDKSSVIASMRRDLTTLRGWLREAQLA
jgi:sugar phosphate isomerase/epimerase